MAPPATKRRKLEHSDSEDGSEGSFADFDGDNGGVALDESDAGDALDHSDAEMDSAEELQDNDDEDMSEEEGNDFEEEEDVHESRKQTTAGKATSASKPSKPPKRPAPSLQDGVYTAESFKSNMFKLQLDELLDQVKLKYGKKEAPAENAMRTLKTIIEQIPSREPLPVCEERIGWGQHKLINRRLPKLRKRSRQPVWLYRSPVLALLKTPSTSCSTNDPRASTRPAATRSKPRLDTRRDCRLIWL